MPYSDLQKRKEYHREYMRNYIKSHKLTPEQKAQKKVYMSEYAKKNTQKFSEYQHNRYLRDKEKISKRKKEKDMMNPEIRKNQSQKYHNRPEVKLRDYQKAAIARNLDFSLSSDEFNNLLFSPCHYCGLENANGVDRKDNNIGYYSYNVVACCKVCNFMKGTLNYQDFINHIAKVAQVLSENKTLEWVVGRR